MSNYLGTFSINGCAVEVFANYRRMAEKRGVRFALSRAAVERLIQGFCCYCGVPPGNRLPRRNFTFLYQGIDRMDNARGYELGNVVPCCGECNSIKGKNLTHSEMLEVGQLLLRLRKS